MRSRYIPLHRLLLFSVIFSGSLAYGQDASSPPQVSVARPLVRKIVDKDHFIGRFQASEGVSVRSRVGGYLEAIDFKDGQMVTKGDQLFVIDQRPFVTALGESNAKLAVAQSVLTYAQTEFDRVHALVKSGSSAVSALDDRRKELDSARADLQGAEASVERARLDLAYSKIMAPLSGRIGRHLVSVGNLVQPDQTELTTIVATDPIHFYFDIDERRLIDYANAARKNGTYLQEGAGGLKVAVRLADERSPSFSGTLDFAENSIDPETGTLRARARFANPSHTLQPGLFGHVEIEASSPYEAMLIPDEAVAADQNERIVYVLDADSTIRSVPVQLGSKIHGYRVVKAGLKGDEHVVVRGVVRVRPGAKVTPVHTELPLEIKSDVPATSEAATVTNEVVR